MKTPEDKEVLIIKINQFALKYTLDVFYKKTRESVFVEEVFYFN